MGTRKRLQLKEAQAVVDAALEKAAADGLKVAVAVVDAKGADLLVVRGDGAPWFSPGVARAKAASSVAFRAPSDAFEPLRESYPDLFTLIDAHI